MRIPSLSNKRGFTLLELMVVLMLVGVLGSVAVPTYLEYMRDAKTGEAAPNLISIKKGAVLYFHAKRQNADGSASNQFLDTAICTSSGNLVGMRQKYLPSDFGPGTDFKQLNFNISEPHFYKYCYVGDKLGFVISATASLDLANDSVYTVSGYTDANGAPSINDVIKEK